MTICLQHIGKIAHAGGIAHELFRDLDMQFDEKMHVAILGPPKSGKTTLLRILCGTEPIYDGKVKRSSSVSWPIPLSSFFSNNLSVAVNLRFVARVYGVRDQNFAEQIAEMAGITEFLGVKLQKCPAIVKQRLPFALGIGMNFDILLFDNQILPRDKEFKEKAAELFQRRVADRGFVLATSTPAEAEPYCDSVFVLENGRAKFFSDAKAGIDYYNVLTDQPAGKKKSKRDQRDRRGEDVEDDNISLPDGVAETELAEAAIGSAID